MTPAGAPRRYAWFESIGRRPVLITGGAGFIGTNLAHRLLDAGLPVIVFDNLSRAGVRANLAWLQEQHPGPELQVRLADVRDARAVREVVHAASVVYHFAAQVAVTASVTDPVTDFEVNARGTLHVLEAARSAPQPPVVLLTSTNKVYGSCHDLRLVAGRERYDVEDRAVRRAGIDEAQPLEFRSPYGCSKGAADQYLLDYAQTYGLPAAVFRMSCIYGPHQFGTEDQGWVAHFLLRAVQEQPVVIYGDGRQVRDILFVDDLVEAMLLAREHIARCAGQPFNIGGGPQHTISLLDLLAQIEALNGHPLPVLFQDWRPGDQRYYVSNCTRFARRTGWTPRVGTREGIARLFAWLQATHAPARAAAGERRAAGAAAPPPQA